MIFRLSSKLATKLKVNPSGVLPLDACPLADWSAHLFTAERVQFLIVTNTASLYSVLTPARGNSTGAQFANLALTSLRDFLEHDGLSPIYEQFLAPASDNVQFSKALSRSVTGSMNDLIVHSKYWLAEGVPLPEIAARLNDIPYSSLDYRKPREAFLALAGE